MLQAIVLLSRQAKITVMVVSDAVLLLVGLWLALSLRYGLWWFPTSIEQIICLAVAVSSSISAFALLGLYRWVIRYVSLDTIGLILKALSVSALVLATVIMFTRAELPRSTPILYVLVSGLLVVSSRFIAQHYLRKAMQKGRTPIMKKGKKNKNELK